MTSLITEPTTPEQDQALVAIVNRVARREEIRWVTPDAMAWLRAEAARKARETGTPAKELLERWILSVPRPSAEQLLINAATYYANQN